MKKVLFTISLIVFGSIVMSVSHVKADDTEVEEQNTDESEEKSEESNSQKMEDKVAPTPQNTEKKLVPNFTLTFDNINDLAQSNALSEPLKKLLASCLKLIRSLVSNDSAVGNDSDLQSAEGYLAQYQTLGNRLRDTESTEKIYKVPELDEAGKNEIERNKQIVELIPQANSLQKVMDLPNLNKDTLERLKAYNGILASIANVKVLSDVYEIPGISAEFIEASKKDAALLDQMKKINSIELLKQFPIANPELLEEIQKLEELPICIKNNTDTIEGTKKIPGLSEKTIVAISRIEKENEVLREQNDKLTRNLQEMSKKFEQAAQVTRNEYYFRMIVISLLERALFGFEFALADDFDNLSSDYSHSIVAHATTFLPWSAGLDRDMWHKVAEIVGSMLQLALSVDDIAEHISWLKKNTAHALSNLKGCNDEKTRFVLEALERLTGILKRYKRNRDSAEFDDFNDRKRIILEKIERLNNSHRGMKAKAEGNKVKKGKESEKNKTSDTKKAENQGKKGEKTKGKTENIKSKKAGHAKSKENEKKTESEKADNTKQKNTEKTEKIQAKLPTTPAEKKN